MGMGVAGLAVLGLGSLFLIIKQIFAPEASVDSHEMERTIEILTGFLWEQNLLLYLQELVVVFIPEKAADVNRFSRKSRNWVFLKTILEIQLRLRIM